MNTKIIIAIAAVAALALAAVGLAAAQLAQNQTILGEDSAVPAQDFWGWIGSCFGGRNAQAGYYGEPASPQVPSQGAPYQSSYGNGYGPCWAAWR
jgi:hypothetical protein